MYTLFPLIIAFIALFIWQIILKIRWNKTPGKLNTRWNATFAIVIFLFLPTLVQTILNMFNCKVYDGETRMVKDLQVQCYKNLHTFVAIIGGVTGFLCVGMGIPTAILYMMCRDRDRLETISVKEKFGFLFNGYKWQSFYWEIIIMYRKILMILISVFLNRIGKIV